MPFQLYKRDGEDGVQRLTYEQQIGLGGRAGPLCKHVHSLARPSGEALPWVLSEADLLTALGYSPAEYSVVIDLKPDDMGLVSLYRLLRIWGFSYSTWTPVGLRLLPLYVDEVVEGTPADFKKSFLVPADKHLFVHEFLYLNGGFDSQPTFRNEWQWGRNGSVNAALLWPEAFTYLVNSMQDAGSDAV